MKTKPKEKKVAKYKNVLTVKKIGFRKYMKMKNPENQIDCEFNMRNDGPSFGLSFS